MSLTSACLPRIRSVACQLFVGASCVTVTVTLDSGLNHLECVNIASMYLNNNRSCGPDPKELHSIIVSRDERRLIWWALRRPELSPDVIKSTMASYGWLVAVGGRKASPLHAAINSDQLDVSRHLVEEGADVNGGEFIGVGPLPFALGLKRYEIARLLIKAGAKVDLLDAEGRTPLYHAIQEDSPVSIVADLLSAGAPKDGVINTFNKSRPLTRAVHLENVPVAKYLLEQSVDVNSCTEKGTTPLNIAISVKHFELSKLLIEHGAYVEGLRGVDDPPLFMAVRFELTDVLELLITHGADVNRLFTPYKYPGNTVMIKYTTALQLAVMINNLKSVQLLLDSGADVNALTPLEHGTALHTAGTVDITQLAHEGRATHRKVVKLLLESGADVNKKGKTGALPVQSIFCMKNWIALEECIRFGLSVNSVIDRETGFTVLHLVVNDAIVHLIELCLDFGADRSIPFKGVRPYRYLFNVGNPKILKLFLNHHHPWDDYTLDRILFTQQSCRALMASQSKLFNGIKKNNVRDVREALADGAVARSTSIEIMHPVHFACSKGYTEIVRLLLEHGAAPSTLDCEGRCALHLAEWRGDSATCTVLLRHGACYNYNYRAEAPSSSPMAVPVSAAVRRHFAMVRRGDGAVVEELRSTLGSEQFWAYINCVNRRGNTLVREALRLGHARIAEAIMDLRLRSS